jgi:hypothetical protein
MTRTIPGQVALALIAVAAVRADPIHVPPLPRLGPTIRAAGLQPGVDEKGKDKIDEKVAPKEVQPEDGPEGRHPPPIRYPLVAYPPAAPLVVDPRSGAWEQVRPSACAVVVLPPAAPVVVPAAAPTVSATPTITTPPVLPVPTPEPNESVQPVGHRRIIQPYAIRNRFTPLFGSQPAAPVPVDPGVQVSSPRLR